MLEIVSKGASRQERRKELEVGTSVFILQRCCKFCSDKSKKLNSFY